MKMGYFDCFSGISGDMCLGAIVDAGVPVEAIRAALATLPVSGYSIEARRVIRGGIGATQVTVRLDQAECHPHRGLQAVVGIIRGGDLPEDVVERSTAVFRNLAEAEARVHGTDAESVHFHEVGAVDAICDIVGTVVGLRELGIEALKFSTIMLGGGTVRAAHGMLPVPAPATAELLRGLPTAGGPVDEELTTPTGAALLKTLGEPCPQWPHMSLEALGHGAGSRDSAAVPNILRLAVGSAPPAGQVESDCVWVLETNLDDMTGQEVGYCTGKLLAGGALDAFATPIQMKKNRPGLRLTVICEAGDLPVMEEMLWKHTSTLGVRRALWQRSKLRREARTVRTPWGEVRLKLAYLGDEAIRREPEYEDCRALADAHGVSLRDVYRAALAAGLPRAGGVVDEKP